MEAGGMTGVFSSLALFYLLLKGVSLSYITKLVCEFEKNIVGKMLNKINLYIKKRNNFTEVTYSFQGLISIIAYVLVYLSVFTGY